MNADTKGKSPFNPGQPVDVELFVGRRQQIERIMTRGAGQTSRGKPINIFVQGEYGIGKSSIAAYTQWLAERDSGLWAIYAPLGGAKTLADVAEIVLRSTIRSGLLNATRSEKVRNWFARYIGKQDLFGITLNIDELKKDAPGLATPFGMLDFLGSLVERMKETGGKGVFLVFDEINGIVSDPYFAPYIKSLVDANSVSRKTLPLLLMLCGVEEKRGDMIRKHEPVGRIFDVVDIDAMDKKEMNEFFNRAFESVRIKVKPDALDLLVHHSAGFPKIMHVVGEAAYWLDKDGVVDKKDAAQAVLRAAEEVGRKFVDTQVYTALRSADYHSILNKIARRDPDDMTFTKSEIAAALTENEKKKFNNFLQKMKSLKVIKSGDVQGEYVFNMRMVKLYIALQSTEHAGGKP